MICSKLYYRFLVANYGVNFLAFKFLTATFNFFMMVAMSKNLYASYIILLSLRQHFNLKGIKLFKYHSLLKFGLKVSFEFLNRTIDWQFWIFCFSEETKLHGTQNIKNNKNIPPPSIPMSQSSFLYSRKSTFCILLIARNVPTPFDINKLSDKGRPNVNPYQPMYSFV